MKKCTLLVVLLLVFAANVFAQSSSISTNEINPNSPVYTGKNPQANSNFDALGDLLRNHNVDSVTPGNAVSFGVVWTGSYYIISQFNANKFYRISANWVKIDSFAITGAAGSFRDMAFAKGLLWGVSLTGQIFGVDTGTKAVVKTITTSLTQLRAITWDPYRNGFWVGTTNFTGPLRFVDTLGAATLSITTPASGLYSVGYEDMGSQATSFLWIGTDQTPTSNTGTALQKYNAGTLAAVGTPLNLTIPLTTGAPLASGGGEVVSNLVPGKRTWVGLVQGTPDRVFVAELSDLPAPPASDSVLVITNDSVLATNLAIRKADKDTLQKYLPMLTSKIRYITKDTNSVLPSLTNYGTIIVQETAFDAILARGLSNPQRTAIKTWLETGTPSAKKSLLLIGGDVGYNYDRAANPFTDTVFSRTYGGFQYLADNAGAAGFNSVINISTGAVDPILTTAGNYYPDGCRPVSGGAAWQRYLNRSATDSVAGIGKVGANWVVATIFQDPRYYSTNGGAGASDVGFKRVLKSALAFLKSNNGTLTGVTPVTTIADKYSLSQNYPNPFNPTTKISFSIPTNGFVTMKIFDVAGKEVMTLVNKSMTVGSYSVDFNGASLSSGVYFYRLESGNFVETKKMMLVK
jgi:hypothetical protein